NLAGAAGAAPDDALTPLPTASGTDWREGRSDFDVPHRLSAGAELRIGGPLNARLAGVYRYRSGDPFTPGFRDGVDANGDGSGRNDPAFVDERIAGVSELARAWPCLRTQSGALAERNACRGPGVHGLDVR